MQHKGRRASKGREAGRERDETRQGWTNVSEIRASTVL